MELFASNKVKQRLFFEIGEDWFNEKLANYREEIFWIQFTDSCIQIYGHPIKGAQKDIENLLEVRKKFSSHNDLEFFSFWFRYHSRKGGIILNFENLILSK